MAVSGPIAIFGKMLCGTSKNSSIAISRSETASSVVLQDELESISTVEMFHITLTSVPLGSRIVNTSCTASWKPSEARSAENCSLWVSNDRFESGLYVDEGVVVAVGVTSGTPLTPRERTATVTMMNACDMFLDGNSASLRQ